MGDSDGDFDDAYYFYPSVMFEIISNSLLWTIIESEILFDELSSKEAHKRW